MQKPLFQIDTAFDELISILRLCGRGLKPAPTECLFGVVLRQPLRLPPAILLPPFQGGAAHIMRGRHLSPGGTPESSPGRAKRTRGWWTMNI